MRARQRLRAHTFHRGEKNTYARVLKTKSSNYEYLGTTAHTEVILLSETHRKGLFEAIVETEGGHDESKLSVVLKTRYTVCVYANYNVDVAKLRRTLTLSSA